MTGIELQEIIEKELEQFCVKYYYYPLILEQESTHLWYCKKLSFLKTKNVIWAEIIEKPASISIGFFDSDFYPSDETIQELLNKLHNKTGIRILGDKVTKTGTQLFLADD